MQASSTSTTTFGITEQDDEGFVRVNAATVLTPGKIHLHLSIPSSRHTRNARIQVASATTVASLERRLAEQFGEDVEVFEARY